MTSWEYAPARESAAAANLRAEYGIFTGGEFRAGSGTPLRPLNPATGEPLTAVAAADESDVDSAVAAARRSFERGWGALPGAERAKLLFRLSRLVQERARELAVLEVLDTGRPVKEANADVPAAAAELFHHAGWADKLEFAGLGPEPRPLGVIAGVLSGGLPLRSLAQLLAPALAGGNTVVLAPSATTPLSALALADLCRQAGFPAGAVNVLPGPDATGAALIAHEGVAGVWFTGSAATGKEVQRALAGSGKRCTLRLGGAAANLVFDDAPLDEAVEGVLDAAFRDRGWAGSRLLVQESIAAEFLAKLLDRAAALRVGDPLDKNTDVGALHSAQRLARLTELADAGEAEGAERWTSPCPLPERGFFFAPTVFRDVQQAMRVAREESAGPLLSALTFRTPDEAVAKANNTRHGLAAGVWTEKGSRAQWVAQRLRAGTVWVNTFHRSDPAAPPGAQQESGSGRAGLEAHLDV